MKGSLGTSLVLHTLVLTWAMVSLSAPAPMTVGDVEALPVDIVPIEEMTQMQQGDKTAPMLEKPAAKPTDNQKIVEGAENAGNNDVDLKAPPTPSKKPTQVETAAAPKPSERPTPTPTPEQNEVKDIAPEETAPKPTEMAALPQTKPEPTPPKPEPTPEPTPAPAQTQAEEIPLPSSIPLPAAKPKPEPPKEQAKPVKKPVEKPVEKKPETKPAETAKPTDKKEGKKQETAKSSSSQKSDFNADEIASLLNKQEASGGGAKRSASPASTGSTKPSTASKLSLSEMDALRGQIQNNWSTIAGIEGLQGMVIRVTFRLDKSGMIIGEPEVTSTGGSSMARRTMEGGALRAVLKSQPFQNLPAEKYDAWSEVAVNFDPSELGL